MRLRDYLVTAGGLFCALVGFYLLNDTQAAQPQSLVPAKECRCDPCRCSTQPAIVVGRFQIADGWFVDTATGEMVRAADAYQEQKITKRHRLDQLRSGKSWPSLRSSPPKPGEGEGK